MNESYGDQFIERYQKFNFWEVPLWIKAMANMKKKRNLSLSHKLGFCFYSQASLSALRRIRHYA
ncbi:CLUMA_CG008815, isoform A [Clunio marinus]|uniref:CLUMA_CG008815, isoform A n=1 Tax=Clunio marinus TaxID=568069 RepID=A0A1J1I8D9_9DIPT|nr:CLUMA_CG008815, isoform A [Clunio marinus]